MLTRLGGSGEVVQVGQARASVQTRSGGSGEVVRARSFGGSSEDVRANLLGWVRRGRPCKIIWAGRARAPK